MPQGSIGHDNGGQPGPSLRAELVRAQLLAVDLKRRRRIDRYIDYFGGGRPLRVEVAGDPYGELLLEVLTGSRSPLASSPADKPPSNDHRPRTFRRTISRA